MNRLSATDQAELNKLVGFLELSSGTTTIFAVAPGSGPQHPVVEQLKFLLRTNNEDFQVQNFFYSDNSLHNFLYSLGETDQQTSQSGHKVVMAFGIDQLPTPRLVREMRQLNLGRESLFGRGLVLIFWLNKAEFLNEFRNRAPDFWNVCRFSHSIATPKSSCVRHNDWNGLILVLSVDKEVTV